MRLFLLASIIMALLGLIGYPIAAGATRDRLMTPSPTPIASRVADGAGPILVAPRDGSILTDAVPDFQFIGLRQSFRHEIYIRAANGTVVIWTPLEDDTPPLSPLPEGRYTWQVCAIGYIDPGPKCSAMTWTFVIQSQATPPPPSATVMASVTPTITPLPTSEIPPVPPLLIAPADGAVLHTGIPDFQYEIVPNAQAYEISIWGANGFSALWVITGFNVTGMDVGSNYTPTPSALPDGVYTWRVCAKRYSSGRGICSTETWTFTIATVAP